LVTGRRRIAFAAALLQISAWNPYSDPAGRCRREAAQVSRKQRFRLTILRREKFTFQCGRQ
jgi:hypothetical protein